MTDPMQRPRRLAWLACALPLLCSAGAPAPVLSPEFGALAPQVLSTGVPAQLPENLSSELGLSATGTTPVRQLATRAGSVVHAFNVGTGRRHSVVLYTYDEQARITRAWLLSPAGRIDKAVSYQVGSPAQVMLPDLAQAGLAAEAQFWIRFTRPRAPAGARP